MDNAVARYRRRGFAVLSEARPTVAVRGVIVMGLEHGPRAGARRCVDA